MFNYSFSSKNLLIGFQLISFFIFTIYAEAKNNQLTPVEAFGELPSKSLVVISPSGKNAAYRSVKDGVDAIVAIELNTGKVLAALDVSEIKPTSLYFIDDERLILVTVTNTKIAGFRGRHDVSTAISYNLKTKDHFRLLTPGKVIRKGQSNVGRVLGISNSGEYAYMPAWDSTGEYSLYKASLDSNKKPKYYMRGTYDTTDYFMDGDQVIARERYDNKYNQHSIEVRVDDDWKIIFVEQTPIQTKAFSGLTPDKKALVMKSLNADSGRWSYYTMALSDGKISQPIFAQNDKDVEHVVTDINRIVYGAKYAGFKPTYEFFNDKLNRTFKAIANVMPNNSFSISDKVPDWSKIVFYFEGQSAAGDYYLFENGGFTFLTTSRPSIASEDVASVVEYSYQARDGLTIPALLTYPSTDKNNLPTIILPHGGPASYDRNGFDWLAQYFASRGYLVVQPQFRGSTGFGIEHREKGIGEWGKKMQDDLTDAVTILAKEGVIDKNKVCIVGASYGGYAALAGATFTPDIYKCAISINGVSDVERMLVTEKRKYGSDHWVVSYWDKIIKKSNFEDDFLFNISPINFVKNISIPVLLIHGEYDKVVPLEQSEDMFDEMEDEDKTVTFVELDKGDHYLSKNENRIQALVAIDKFISKHMK